VNKCYIHVRSLPTGQKNHDSSPLYHSISLIPASYSGPIQTTLET
jgi:hypothetical protein